MFRAPTEAGLPPISILLDDIGAVPAKLARHLGVSISTLARWRRTGNAPRLALLALFWESRWGASYTHTDLFNDARLHAQHAATLMVRVEQLEHQIADLLQERAELVKSAGWHRPANDPFAQPGQPCHIPIFKEQALAAR